jgi:KEOPS complex subunit Cgi121
MEHRITVIGVTGDCPFDRAVEHFTSMGGEVILLNPLYVYGERHVLSAVMHAERAFANGTHRSKTLLTETIMYIAGERQASKALKKVRPVSDSGPRVAVLFDIDDPKLDEIGLVRDDSVIAGTPEKAAAMGLDAFGQDVDFEELALESVAMLDIEKQ